MEDNANPIVNRQNIEEETNLLEIAKKLWTGRLTVIKTIVVCGIIGVIIAITSPQEYTASTVLVPQNGKSTSLGGLSSLAAMAGFSMDMSSSGESLSPMIYPQIVSSVPFQLELMNTPFHFSNAKEPLSLFTYYTMIKKPGILSKIKKYTIGLPGIIFQSIKPKGEIIVSKSELLSITEKEEKIRKIIAKSVTISISQKEGYITLTANMPEAKLAAEVVEKAKELLQHHITNIKIQKSTDQLKFIEDRYNEKKANFERAQLNLAAFRDRNRTFSTSIARTQEERLQSEYTIAFQVYSELAKQFEQAQIKVKEDTPILAVVSPAVVPIEKSKPKRLMILSISLFLGTLIGFSCALGKEYFTFLMKEIFNN